MYSLLVDGYFHCALQEIAQNTENREIHFNNIIRFSKEKTIFFQEKRNFQNKALIIIFPATCHKGGLCV